MSDDNGITGAALRQVYLDALRADRPLAPALAIPLLEAVEDAMSAADADTVEELAAKLEKLLESNERIENGRDEDVTRLEGELEDAKSEAAKANDELDDLRMLVSEQARALRGFCAPHLLMSEDEIARAFGPLERAVDEAGTRRDKLLEARAQIQGLTERLTVLEAAAKERKKRRR